VRGEGVFGRRLASNYGDAICEITRWIDNHDRFDRYDDYSRLAKLRIMIKEMNIGRATAFINDLMAIYRSPQKTE